jgi:hypothetical protein
MSHFYPVGLEIHENFAHANHQNLFDPATQSGGLLRMLLLCAPYNPPTVADPDEPTWQLKNSIKHLTVAACLAQTGYFEYDGAGYPGPSGGGSISSRVIMPALDMTLDTTNDELDIDLPAGAPGIVSLGSPAAASEPIRAKLIYWHFSGTDDANNIPLLMQDQGTIVGTNGNSQAMTASWSGVFAKTKNKV